MVSNRLNQIYLCQHHTGYSLKGRLELLDALMCYKTHQKVSLAATETQKGQRKR